MKALKKTNACRLLDEAGITYELRDFPIGEEHLDGEEVAKLVNLPPEEVFKTLCARSDKGAVLFACIPVTGELDLKALARADGCKRAELVHLKELFPLTGYVRGGCSPLGAVKPYPVYIDETCILWERIAVSAGRRGLQLLLRPEDLVRAAKAVVAPLTAE